MQIAGVLNRVSNMFAITQKKCPDVLCDQKLEEQPETYQGISRLTHYLRALEAKSTFNLDKIRLPRTYLIGLKSDLPTKANDETSVIVQEKVHNARPVCEVIGQIAGIISEEAVKQVFIMTVYAGLWDLEKNLLIDTSVWPYMFVISDLEQPNGSNPHDFFHKNEGKVFSNIRSGINHLNKIFGQIPHLRGICQKFAQMSNEEFKQIGSGTLPESLKC
jgi:hypothetical protein